jgi:hypothetical protein
MSAASVLAAVAAMRAAHDELAGLSLDALNQAELVEVMDELETLGCQLPTQTHRALARLQAETTPTAMGAKSWRSVLAIRWRISTSEAGRRLDEAAELGPRRALTGQPLKPLLAATAAAQARGTITGEHVTVIRTAIRRLPGWVDAATHDHIEADLAAVATGVGPKPLKDHAARILFLLDQDGPEPNDAERDRRRGLTLGKQRPDATTALNGTLTPEASATLEAVFAKLAAPGMCNPADPHPCISGTPTQAQIDDDHRTLAQRQHDALIVIGRSALCSGQLGKHNGLPTSIIIRTTLQDLESRAGVGVTGGGTMMPIKDVIRLAAHANHYLAVFDGATGSALDLFRTRRVASPAQRLMLISRDGGCTKPNCTVPAYGSQVHHAARDWADDGNTNVDELGLACGPDNRMVGPQGWTTRMNDHHEVEWIPPPHLDTGQARINHYHHPERLIPPTNDALTHDESTTSAPPAPEHPWANFDQPAPKPPPPPDDRWATKSPWDFDDDDPTHQPGGPEPNAA